MSKVRVYSAYAIEACRLFGGLIQLGRKNKKWTAQDLADRAGITRLTLHKIEQGEMSCSIGLFFEVAALVGVSLYDMGEQSLSKQLGRVDDKLALLPKSIRQSKKVVDDEF
ncbi:MAG: helix-turn-helix transcriptional regulator [Legionella sp.]|jgi:transcriptional regulator with XRE-family HTH domain